MGKHTYELECNIAQSLNIIGDRWTLLIINEIMTGHKTFNEIKQYLTGVSANILSERLKSLEEDGLITSVLYSAHPPRYEYQLTESGRELNKVFGSLILWGRKHLKKCFRKITHIECQHEVEMRYYCPHCEKVVENISVLPVESSEEKD